jgi:hypothetical protein
MEFASRTQDYWKIPTTSRFTSNGILHGILIATSRIINLRRGDRCGAETSSLNLHLCEYCIIVKIKVFISRSCLILVLTVLFRPRRAYAKNSVKNNQGRTTS